MNELQDLIKIWDERIGVHSRIARNELMFTEGQRLRSSHHLRAIWAVIADLKELAITPPHIYTDLLKRSVTLFEAYLNHNNEEQVTSEIVEKVIQTQYKNENSHVVTTEVQQYELGVIVGKMVLRESIPMQDSLSEDYYREKAAETLVLDIINHGLQKYYDAPEIAFSGANNI